MKKKTITADEIELELKKMGAIEITEEEFNTSAEYKNISNYVNSFFNKSIPAKKVHRKTKVLKKKVV